MASTCSRNWRTQNSGGTYASPCSDQALQRARKLRILDQRTHPALPTQLLPDTAPAAKSGVESHRCQSSPARTRIGRQTNRRNSNEIRLEDRLMLRVYSPLQLYGDGSDSDSA